MKEKIKTLSFWLGVGASIILILDCVSEIFGFAIKSEIVQNIIVTICSVLVLLGVITKKNIGDSIDSTSEELMQEIKINTDETKKD
ncbi:MAG: hypothetical protein IJW59_01935 [Clostridia bacterium]|nr:hypothetical protein [Clostridia bacterium]